MLIASKVLISDLTSAIVTSIHGLTVPNGATPPINTIDPQLLRTAALIAIQIATGQPVWPADVPITIPRRAPLSGPFREE